MNTTTGIGLAIVDICIICCVIIGCCSNPKYSDIHIDDKYITLKNSNHLSYDEMSDTEINNMYNV